MEVDQNKNKVISATINKLKCDIFFCQNEV